MFVMYILYLDSWISEKLTQYIFKIYDSSRQLYLNATIVTTGYLVFMVLAIVIFEIVNASFIIPLDPNWVLNIKASDCAYDYVKSF